MASLSRHSWPLDAVTTDRPARSSRSQASSWFRGWSSTSSTRAPASWRCACLSMACVLGSVASAGTLCPSTRLKVSSRVLGVTGLLSTPARPTPSAAFMASSRAKAVTSSTQGRCPGGTDRAWRAKVMPSMPGIFQSDSRMWWGLPSAMASRMRLRACSPLSVTSTSRPMRRVMSPSTSRAAALSSTSSRRLPCISLASSARRLAGWFCTPKHAVKWKVEPLPTSLSTQISPPIISTSWREIARPRPVPPYWRVVELSPWVKGKKSRSSCSCDMPMPLSRTQKCSTTLAASRDCTSQPISTSPRSVNLMALVPRLMRIWPRRVGSPIRAVGMSGGAVKSSSMPFSSARTPSTSAMWLMTVSSWKSVRSISSLPDSILETSSTSLRICSRLAAARCTFSM